MAFTEFYCNASTGSNLNAGSSEGVPTVTYASGTWVQSTRVFTVASGDPVADGVNVGDFVSVYADGASAPTGFVGRVTARDTTTITVSATASSGTAPTDGTSNRTLVVGGVWKGPDGASGFPFGFATAALTNASAHPFRCNLKNNATYAITAAITHNVVGSQTFQGYATTPGDFGKLTLDGGATGTSYVLLTFGSNATSTRLADAILQNNGNSGTSDGLVGTTAAAVICERVVVHNVRGDGFDSITKCIECEAYAVGGGGASSGFLSCLDCINCISHDNTGSGFRATNTSGRDSSFVNCIADTNTTKGFDLPARTACHQCVNCDAWSNGSDGFYADVTVSAPSWLFVNCNSLKNGGYGFNRNGTGTDAMLVMLNCAVGAGTQANTSGATNFNANTGLQQLGTVTYADNVTPWVDPDNGDFRINLAAAQGTGRGVFTQTAASYAGTIGYPDIGAARHQPAAGGGGSSTISGILTGGRM